MMQDAFFRSVFARKKTTGSEWIPVSDRFEWSVLHCVARTKRVQIDIRRIVLPFRMFVSVLVFPWSTSRSTNTLSNGIACSCTSNRQRARAGNRKREACHRCMLQRARKRASTSREAFCTSRGHVPNDEMRFHAPRRCRLPPQRRTTTSWRKFDILMRTRNYRGLSALRSAHRCFIQSR